MDNKPAGTDNLNKNTSGTGKMIVNKKVLIIAISAVVLAIITVTGFLSLNKQKTKEIIVKPVVCNLTTCASGCCVGDICQSKDKELAGYSCIGGSKWKSVADNTVVIGPPKAVIEEVKKEEALSLTPGVQELIPTSASKETAEILMKVDEETIFKKDLDGEIYAYPLEITAEVRKNLMDKLTDDSKTLQKARSQGLIQLDSTVYNSSDKDYMKRIELVQKAKQLFDNQESRVSGTVIAIWFYNTKIGSLGYEKGKELAFTKIRALHDEVKSGKITIRQAAEKIKNDISLAQIDQSYKNNAEYVFDVKKGEKITFDSQFDSTLFGLKAGDISDVYLIKDKPLKETEEIDAVYMFGQVDKNTLK